MRKKIYLSGKKDRDLIALSQLQFEHNGKPVNFGRLMTECIKCYVRNASFDPVFLSDKVCSDDIPLKKVVHITLSPEKDKDVIEWLNHVGNRNMGLCVKAIFRFYLSEPFLYYFMEPGFWNPGKNITCQIKEAEPIEVQEKSMETMYSKNRKEKKQETDETINFGSEKFNITDGYEEKNDMFSDDSLFASLNL